MSVEVRASACSVDDLLALVRSRFPVADTVVVGWERRSRRVTVLGLLSEGRQVGVSSSVLAALSGVPRVPFAVDAWRLAYPGSDVFVSSAGTVDVDVDAPWWALIAEHVSGLVEQGMRVSDEDVRDAVAIALEQVVGLAPSGASLVRRSVFPVVPDDLMFVPVSVSFVGGEVWPWDRVVSVLPEPAVSVVALLLCELAERRQHVLFPQVLAEVSVVV